MAKMCRQWIRSMPTPDDASEREQETTSSPVPAAAPPIGRITPPLKLTYFDGCSAVALTRWNLKGIIARNETSAWIAPPGAGKSALLTEISVHCAARIGWRGYRAKEACGVVIFALERADLFKRRLDAYRQRDSLQGLPIAVADAVIDLLNPACVDTIVATVREAEKHFGLGVGLIGIDTYAKGIAANGGDEDKAKDQNRAAANLRSVHSRLENNVHIALVGHTGKDESRGARGSMPTWATSTSWCKSAARPSRSRRSSRGTTSPSGS
jgi:RecA-family ATPase